METSKLGGSVGKRAASIAKTPVTNPKWPVVGICTLAAVLAWAYWPTFCEIAQRWATDPRYSHGYFVPVFALALLWLRRNQLKGKVISPNPWGLAILVAGIGLHQVGARFYLEWFSAASLLPCLAGLCVGLGGWQALRWAWPSIAFLGFMLPLPYGVEMALSHPLQRLATLASTYILQLIGVPAVSEGNVIFLENTSIGVVDACNGLGMLVTFFALSTGLAIVLSRPWIDKAFLVLSAIPIALMANVARVTITGLLYWTLGQETGDKFYSHDLAGIFLMPFALLLLWLELVLISYLFVERPLESSRAFVFSNPGPAKGKQKLSKRGD
jgi:exosortase